MDPDTTPRVWLREWRKHRKVLQRELHAQTGISITTLSRMEKRHTKGVDFDTLAKLARALDVEPACLFVEPGTSVRCR